MVKAWQTTARGQALLILEEVLDQGAYSNLALKAQLDSSQLSVQDKGLVTELVYGTLARKLTLEWYLSHVIADRDKLDSWVYYLLMLSLYQLLYLDKVPDHAVVNDAVAIAKSRSPQSGAEKFVNALLRRLQKEGVADVTSIKRVNKRYAIQYSLPVWLVKKLIDQYGEERAVKLFASLHDRSKASIRVVDPGQLDQIQAATGADRSQLSPVGLTKPAGHFAATEAFAQGQITIQDETSQLVAPTLDLQGHEQVLDACAAPGGKTVHMASYLTTGQVTALDLYDHKLKLIADNAARLGVADRVKTLKMDASQVHEHFPADSFDKILVDAPCSGIGLIRRKPDLKYRKELADFTTLQAIQLEILSSVCQTLRVGGIITYSTCTIVDEENRQVISAFLDQHSNFELVALSHEQESIVADGMLTITPEQFGTDGFFIAQVKRCY